jgi:hypothetical protein
MSSKNPTHNVAVHKAAITLGTGESIGQFTSRIREAGVKFLKQKLNLTKAGIYPVEIFSKTIVFNVYKFGDSNTTGEAFDKLYAVAFTRKNSGDFEFGTLIEVERVTSYHAKSKTMDVTKSLHPGWVEKSLWGGIL